MNISLCHYTIQGVLSTTLRQIMTPWLIIVIITGLPILRLATESPNPSFFLSLSLHLPRNKKTQSVYKYTKFPLVTSFLKLQ
jgi:hypothetical protein